MLALYQTTRPLATGYKVYWVRNEDEQLICRAEGAQNIEPDAVQIIFEKKRKWMLVIHSHFTFPKFRKACKVARLLIVIGYSFGDSHINQILSGALREKTQKRDCSLFVVL